jgi:hypothetical protein
MPEFTDFVMYPFLLADPAANISFDQQVWDGSRT